MSTSASAVHSSPHSALGSSRAGDRGLVLLLQTGLHGAFLRSALVQSCGRHQLANALRTGVLHPLWTGVVVETARLLDIRTRAAAALLTVGPEAVLCGPTAAALHGSTAFTSAEVHVLVPYSRRPRNRPGLIVHHSCFYGEQVVELDGLRLLAFAQTVADLLCTASPADALAVGDEALRMVRPRCDELRDAVSCRLRARPDPRGTVRGAALWDLASPRAESVPESWVRMLLIVQGFPLPEVNFPLLTPDGTELYPPRPRLAKPADRAGVRRSCISCRSRGAERRAGGRPSSPRLDRRPGPGRRPGRPEPGHERTSCGLRPARLHLVRSICRNAQDGLPRRETRALQPRRRPVETRNTACQDGRLALRGGAAFPVL
jgi:hypothetical protein